MKILNIGIFFLTVAFFYGCKQKESIPTKSIQTNLVIPGDIVVVNSGRSLVVLDSDGNFKSVLYELDNITESIYGVAFKSDTKEIIFTINGSPRVGAVSVMDGAYRNFITDKNLTGLLKGLVQLKNGDILVAEASSIERFNTNGVRIVSLVPPVLPIITSVATPILTVEQISPTNDGGFVVCSSGSDSVLKFDKDSKVVTHPIVKGPALTLDAMGCIELVDGKIAMAFSGTSDQVMTIPSNMTGTNKSLYIDAGQLATPKTLSLSLNGNLLVVDSGFNQIVEITTDGLFVRTLGGSVLGAPNAAFSVPNY